MEDNIVDFDLNALKKYANDNKKFLEGFMKQVANLREGLEPDERLKLDEELKKLEGSRGDLEKSIKDLNEQMKNL